MANIPVRQQNLLLLFSEFVTQRQAQEPGRALAGLDKEFAVALQINNTYLSGMKTGSRGIGNKLAHQIEVARQKPKGWLDEIHGEAPATSAGLSKFLALAQKAYLAADSAKRKSMIAALTID